MGIIADKKAPAGKFRLLAITSLEGGGELFQGDFDSLEEAQEVAKEKKKYLGANKLANFFIFNDKEKCVSEV